MKSKLPCILMTIILMALVGCSTSPLPTPTSVPSPTYPPQPTLAPVEPTANPPAEPTAPPVEPTIPSADPFALISQESPFAFMEDLTAIQPYSGWRNSASQGEAEALDYVAERLGEFEYLQDLGLALERQSFHVFWAPNCGRPGST